ncbi:uncharacterized protein LOC129720430 [Wyeomyia smithii]|uniref:uncharacterized protein LOC129720430 n=1 Tax=Wyeomyia smithii TaxID=174621 RepID=UPI002467D8D8|nr:uncharacterized protein LOC129720430 [Wyeomyia smithii]
MVAKRYMVPLTTLHRHVKHPPRNDRPGPLTLLRPEEEARFEQWAFYMARAGFPINETDLIYAVKDYADKIRETRNLPPSFPSKNWPRRFLQRHPLIKKKFTTNLSRSGANVTENVLRMWFSEIESIFEEEGIDMSIFNFTNRIFNFDESGFRLVPKAFKALCESNVENTYIVNNDSDKESYTILFGANAAGELTPPMILYPGQRISREIAESIPKGWSVGVSEEGWQTSKTFYEYMANDYFNWLVKSKIELPVVVFLDGHKSHISIELMEFCKQQHIILVSLYPNSTRILQPLDRSFFGPFKDILNKVLRKFQLGNNSARITKTNFPKLLKTALDNFTNLKECLKSAFKLCGLCPWNVNAINFSILPTNATKAIEDPMETIQVAAKTFDASSQTTVNDHELQLQYVELGLKCDQLTRFLDNWKKDYWYGPLDELALFNFWKLTKDKAEGLLFTEPLQQSNSVTLDFIVNTYDECSYLSTTAHSENADAARSESSDCRAPLTEPSSAQSEFLYPASTNDLTDITLETTGATYTNSRDPFEEVLVWPRVQTNGPNQRKRRGQEHVPSVSTSNRWLEWYKKKDLEKKEIEDAKKARIEERKIKKKQRDEDKHLKDVFKTDKQKKSRGKAKKK